jgi:hypothetical protein
LVNRGYRLGGKDGAPRPGQNLVIGPGNVRERGGAALLRAPLGGVVELCDMVGERIHQWPVERSLLGQRVEQRTLVEAFHHDNPVDSRAVLDKADLSCRVAAEPAQIEVKRRRGAAVQRQLGGTGGAPLPGGRKIEIGELDRALQFVGAVAGEKHQGHMRLDPLDQVNPRPVRGRPSEKSDRCALVVGLCPVRGAH